VVKLAVLNKEGKESGSVDISDDIFGKYVNSDVIHQAVVMYQASLRQGNADTKERAEVSGGGRKPYKQKGTGRARAGSSRSPLWKGGGVTFGPTPRDFSYTLPQKLRLKALKESLNAKHQDGNLIIIDDLKEALTKTKEFATILKNLDINCKVLAVLDGSDESIMRVSKNITRFQLMRGQDVNAFHLIKFKKVILTKTALDNLINRIQK
jgi:large subunit ribosomal protein L4